jgi:hypothetical protein
MILHGLHGDTAEVATDPAPVRAQRPIAAQRTPAPTRPIEAQQTVAVPPPTGAGSVTLCGSTVPALLFLTLAAAGICWIAAK